MLLDPGGPFSENGNFRDHDGTRLNPSVLQMLFFLVERTCDGETRKNKQKENASPSDVDSTFVFCQRWSPKEGHALKPFVFAAEA